MRFPDPFKCPIRTTESASLNERTFFVIFFKKMLPSSYHRVKSLTKETSKSLVHNCHGLVDLGKYLISIKWTVYIRPFRVRFWKALARIGWTYFITAQKVLEKVAIAKAKLLLQMIVLLNQFQVILVIRVVILMDEKTANIFDNLPDLEKMFHRMYLCLWFM